MPKWKKEQTKFSVGLFYNERRGHMATIPKPIVEQLGDPEKIVFAIGKDGDVEVYGEN